MRWEKRYALTRTDEAVVTDKTPARLLEGRTIYLASECGYRISVGVHGDMRSYLAAWQGKEIVDCINDVPANDPAQKKAAIAKMQAACEQHEADRLRGAAPR